MAKKLWCYDSEGNLVQGEVFMEYTSTILRPTRKKWLDKKAKIWEWDDKGDEHVLLKGIHFSGLKKDTFKTKKEAIASKKPLALVELW